MISIVVARLVERCSGMTLSPCVTVYGMTMLHIENFDRGVVVIGRNAEIVV